MKRFAREDVIVAVSWAGLGHQALVMFFQHHAKEQGAKGWRYGRLFDFDETRLLRTARALGISRATIVRGRWRFKGGAIEAPYVEVWGEPLGRAVRECRIARDAAVGGEV